MSMKKSMAKPRQHPAGPLREDETRSARWIGLGSTLMIHLLLLLLFAFLRVGWQYDIPEWVEMEFLSLNPQPARATEAPPPPAPMLKEPQTPEARTIRLPRRRMLEEETPRLPLERKQIYEEAEPATDLIRREYRSEQERPEMPLPRRDRGKKTAAEGHDLKTGIKPVEPQPADLGKGVSIPFIIEGEAAERTVVHRVIPQYPAGLAREAVVKIGFVVLPSGVVANAVPILKGDAELEKIALEAFRQWRFNPLPPEAEQKEQRGVITFRFVLK